MGVIAPERILGGEIHERDIPGVGLLRFESCRPGEWLTAKGEPAKKAHRCYRIDDRELDSVSSIVGTLSKEALIAWTEEQTAIGVARAFRAGELDDCPEEEIVDRLKLLGLGASAARDDGADRGNAIHAVFERLARGEDMPPLATLPESWHPWARGAAKAWLMMDAEPHEVELSVCHPDLGYAGRLDFIATSRGARTLYDYKTNKGRVYDAAHYQTRLYALALEASGVEPVDRIVIVGIADDSSAQLVECEASEEDALELLHVYRSRKRVNAGMAAQRKALKAAKAREAA